MRVRVSSPRQYNIGRWPNWLRFVIWDHESAGSSPVLPTNSLLQNRVTSNFRLYFILYSIITGIDYGGIILIGSGDQSLTLKIRVRVPLPLQVHYPRQMGKVGIRDMGQSGNNHISLAGGVIIECASRKTSHKLKLKYIGRDGDRT